MLKPKIKSKIAEHNNMAHQEFAKIIDVKPQTLSGWVTGKNKPSLEQAFKIAHTLGCKVDDLWEYEDDKNKGE